MCCATGSSLKIRLTEREPSQRRVAPHEPNPPPLAALLCPLLVARCVVPSSTTHPHRFLIWQARLPRESAFTPPANEAACKVLAEAKGSADAVSDVERWRVFLAAQLIVDGAEPPWPPTLVALAIGGGEATAKVCAALVLRTPPTARPRHSRFNSAKRLKALRLSPPGARKARSNARRDRPVCRGFLCARL